MLCLAYVEGLCLKNYHLVDWEETKKLERLRCHRLSAGDCEKVASFGSKVTMRCNPLALGSLIISQCLLPLLSADYSQYHHSKAALRRAEVYKSSIVSLQGPGPHHLSSSLGMSLSEDLTQLQYVRIAIICYAIIFFWALQALKPFAKRTSDNSNFYTSESVKSSFCSSPLCKPSTPDPRTSQSGIPEGNWH